MRHRLRSACALLPLCLLATCLPAADAELVPPSPALWLATQAGEQVYLFGSVHVGGPQMYPMPPAVDAAFAAAEALAVEVDISDPQVAAQAAPFLQYPAGEDLTQHLQAKSVELLDTYLKGIGQSAALMKQFKPWVLVTQVIMIEAGKLGFNPALGIDQYFLNRAKKAGKPVVALETVASQMKLLDGLDQDLFLQMTLQQLDKNAEMLLAMVAAWRAGDLQALEKLAITEPLRHFPEMQDFYKLFLDQRNEEMATAIIKHCQTYDTLFVVVGAAHLVGEASVQKFLQDQGWKVEALNTAPEPVGAELP